MQRADPPEPVTTWAPPASDNGVGLQDALGPVAEFDLEGRVRDSVGFLEFTGG